MILSGTHSRKQNIPSTLLPTSTLVIDVSPHQESSAANLSNLDLVAALNAPVQGKDDGAEFMDAITKGDSNTVIAIINRLKYTNPKALYQKYPFSDHKYIHSLRDMYRSADKKSALTQLISSGNVAAANALLKALCEKNLLTQAFPPEDPENEFYQCLNSAMKINTELALSLIEAMSELSPKQLAYTPDSQTSFLYEAIKLPNKAIAKSLVQKLAVIDSSALAERDFGTILIKMLQPDTAKEASLIINAFKQYNPEELTLEMRYFGTPLLKALDEGMETQALEIIDALKAKNPDYLHTHLEATFNKALECKMEKVALSLVDLMSQKLRELIAKLNGRDQEFQELIHGVRSNGYDLSEIGKLEDFLRYTNSHEVDLIKDFLDKSRRYFLAAAKTPAMTEVCKKIKKDLTQELKTLKQGFFDWKSDFSLTEYRLSKKLKHPLNCLESNTRELKSSIDRLLSA